MNGAKGITRWAMGVAVCGLLVPAMAAAQDFSQKDPCSDRHSDRPSYCEVRNLTVPATGDLSVNARPNGGIRVQGWDRAEIQARAIITAQADTDDEAAALAKQVQIKVDGGQLRSEGPRNEEDRSWSASFELMVPRQVNLDLRSTNGGISINDVAGRLEFETTNGGINVARIGGNAHGRTQNGGVHVELEGQGWQGDGLDIETTNGGVRLTLPDNYSAHLETGTTNGGLSIDFPVTVQGEIKKTLSTDLGSGGPTLRLVTVNGGVKIGRK